jgi:hypothetical protein
VELHKKRQQPLLEFPDVLVFSPVPDPYVSLTPTELAAFGIGPASISNDDDDDEEEEVCDDEEMKDDE